MPNIGLSDKTYEQLNKIKGAIEKENPMARPTYDSIVSALIKLHNAGKRLS